MLQYFVLSITRLQLSQTGLIPDGTESINFLIGPYNGPAMRVVTLNGVDILLFQFLADEWPATYQPLPALLHNSHSPPQPAGLVIS